MIRRRIQRERALLEHQQQQEEARASRISVARQEDSDSQEDSTSQPPVETTLHNLTPTPRLLMLRVEGTVKRRGTVVQRVERTTTARPQPPRIPLCPPRRSSVSLASVPQIYSKEKTKLFFLVL